MVGFGKVSWRMVGGEGEALRETARSTPIRWLVPDEHRDAAARRESPIVFVDGLPRDPANTVVLHRRDGVTPRASPGAGIVAPLRRNRNPATCWREAGTDESTRKRAPQPAQR